MINSITGGQGFVTERPLTQYEAEALESAGTPKWPNPALQPCGNDAYSQLKPGQTCRDCYGRLFMRLDYDKCGSDWALVNDVPDKVGFDSQDFSPPSKPPIVSGFLAYFPDAVMEVAKVSAAGNRQHGTTGWDKSVSPDELNALGRHLIAHTQGSLRDSDGTLHLAKVAWRAMAALQRLLEA